MGNKYKFCCVLIYFFSTVAFTQGLNEIIGAINTRYRNIDDIFSYDVNSKNKSLISDTVKYFYSSHIICNPLNQHDSIKDFICSTRHGALLFAFLNMNLLKHDTVNHIIHSQYVESPYALFKRGEVKWAVFTPFIFKKNVIDVNKWNEARSEYTISYIGDTAIIEMCNTIVNEPFYFSDDPRIGSTQIRMKINIKDLLIYEYIETKTISKKPEITQFQFSNYRFHIKPVFYDSILLVATNDIDQLPKTIAVNLRDSVDKYKLDLTNNFSDTFMMYDLDNDSLRIFDLKKRYYIIDFWFFGCYPCSKASKVLNDLAKSQLPEDLQIIGINFLNNSPKKIKQFIDEKKIVYSQYFVKSNNGIRFLDWYGAPIIILYDRKERKVLKFIEGFNDEAETKLRNMIVL